MNNKPATILVLLVVTSSVFFFLHSSSSSSSYDNKTDSTGKKEISEQEKRLLARELVSLENDDDRKSSKESKVSNNNIKTAASSKRDSSSSSCQLFLPPRHPSFYQVRPLVALTFLKEALFAVRSVAKLEAEMQSNAVAVRKERERFAKVEHLIADRSRLEKLRETPLLDHRVWLFATDGTLLNLMRFGSIVNDNDVDISFVVLPYNLIDDSAASSSSEDFRDPKKLAQVAKLIRRAAFEDKDLLRKWYITLLFSLVRAGLVDRPDNRILKGLKHNYKNVKPRRCLIRRGAMQCRLSNGVLIDFFGPENSFVARPGFKKEEETQDEESTTSSEAVKTLKNFFPLAACKSYDSVFPCPRKSLFVLKSFTLDYSLNEEKKGSKNKKENKKESVLVGKKKTNDNKKQKQKGKQQEEVEEEDSNEDQPGETTQESDNDELQEKQTSSDSSSGSIQIWNEFGGCALFSRRRDEHDSQHVVAILQSTKRLRDCGFPSLYEDRKHPECQKIIKKCFFGLN